MSRGVALPDPRVECCCCDAETSYRLIKKSRSNDGNGIAVRFCYEYHNADGYWSRTQGNENWEFGAKGDMAVRRAALNDRTISVEKRLFHWPQGPWLEDHPGLTELGH